MRRDRPSVPWLLVVLLVLVLVSGGAAVVAVTVSEEQRKVREALRAAAVRWGLPPDWLDALGYVESKWRLSAVNKAGADGERGGAFGPTQITAATARLHGYTGDPAAFTRDLALAAEWTARILVDSRPRTFADAVGAWNAGRYNADTDDDGTLDALAPSHQTVRDYWPKAAAALAMVEAERDADAFARVVASARAAVAAAVSKVVA